MSKLSEMRQCTESDCDRRHYGKGLCKKHYNREHRRGRTPGTCSVDGCERSTGAMGGRMCATHYRRIREGHPLDLPVRGYGQTGCNEPGCDEPHAAWGLCKFHYARAKYDPDADHADRALRSKYGITREDRDLLIESQGGVCAICKLPPGPRGLSVDHDHSHCDRGVKKGCRVCVRGMLCDGCNTGLARLEKAGGTNAYLENPPAYSVLPNRVPFKARRAKPFAEEEALLKELGLR